MGEWLSALFEFVVLYVVVRFLGKAFQGFLGSSRLHINTSGEIPRGAPFRKPETVQGEVVRDPVCGMFVSTEVSHRLPEGQQVLHFCSRDCLEQYQKKTAHA
jgi:YHS domain-containing protein